MWRWKAFWNEDKESIHFENVINLISVAMIWKSIKWELKVDVSSLFFKIESMFKTFNHWNKNPLIIWQIGRDNAVKLCCWVNKSEEKKSSYNCSYVNHMISCTLDVSSSSYSLRLIIIFLEMMKNQQLLWANSFIGNAN